MSQAWEPSGPSSHPGGAGGLPPALSLACHWTTEDMLGPRTVKINQKAVCNPEGGWPRS